MDRRYFKDSSARFARRKRAILSSLPDDAGLLLLVLNDGIGGVARPMIHLTRELRERGRDVRLVFPGTESGRRVLAWCSEQGVTAELGPPELEENLPRTRQSMRAMKRFVRSSGAEIVSLHYGRHCLTLKDTLAVHLAGRRRLVQSIYSPFPWSQYPQARGQRRSTRLAAGLSRTLTVLSDWSKRELTAIGIAERRIAVVPPGMPQICVPLPRDEARRHLNLPPSAFVVMTHGRLAPEKGIGDVIEAASRIRTQGDDLSLIVAGDGPERVALGAQARAKLGDRARMMGHVADPTALYAAADLFVLASRAESFGIVYIEAALLGVPSIGANVGAVPETVLDGETGLIVPPRDIEALTAAIQKLQRDPELRERLGTAACKRAGHLFTTPVIADRYEKIFWG